MRLYNEDETEASREIFRDLRYTIIMLGIVNRFAPPRQQTIAYCMVYRTVAEVVEACKL